MKKITNNDILKNFLRLEKSANPESGELLKDVTGVMINSANQAKLSEWVRLVGQDPAEIIAAEREFIHEAETKKPLDAPVDTPADAPAANKLADALTDLIGNIDGKDEQVRNDVAWVKSELDRIGRQVEHLESNNISEMFVTSPKLEKVNVGKVHYCFEQLLTALSCGLNPMLVGPAGSFKTSSAEKAAKALNLECSAISVCAQTTASALLGYLNATGEYVATEFRKRYENGGLFILDEIDNGNPNVLAVLNSALANESCAFPDGMIAKHEDFRLVSTANTFGTGANAQYVGRNALDAATLDRFFNIEWGYDEKLELSLAPNEACRKWTEKVISYRKAAEELKVKMVISPRASFAGWKLIAAGMKVSQIEKGLIWKGAKSDVIKKVKENVKQREGKEGE